MSSRVSISCILLYYVLFSCLFPVFFLSFSCLFPVFCVSCMLFFVHLVLSFPIFSYLCLFFPLSLFPSFFSTNSVTRVILWWIFLIWILQEKVDCLCIGKHGVFVKSAQSKVLGFRWRNQNLKTSQYSYAVHDKWAYRKERYKCNWANGHSSIY